MNYLKEYGSKLIKNGYKIIPIKPGFKAPSIAGWQKVNATQETLNKWLANGYEDHGIGILTEYSPAIDIDVQDFEIVEKLLTWCKKNLGITLYRAGKAPKVLLPFQTDKPFSKMFSNQYEDFLGNTHRIEVLGKGQQYVALHIHPETKKPYEWFNGSLLTTPRGQLPSLTPEKVQKLFKYFESIIPPDWEIKDKGKETQASMDPLENLKPPLNVTPVKIKNCLDLLDPDHSYDRWIKIGMALYHQSRGSIKGFQLWDEWSLKGAKYQEGLTESKWPTFKENLETTNPVTCATLIKLAKEQFTQDKLEKSKVKFSHVTSVISKLGKVKWLVKNYIEENTLGIFFGDPASYKSFLALSMALNCALGTPWNGCNTKQGPVIYIAGEGHGGLARRISAWAKETGTDLSKAPIYFSEQSASLYNQESAEDVANTVEMLIKDKPGLVIIDTLARNFGPGDENSTADMNLFIEHVDQLIRARFKCCVLLVHHTGHREKHRARGSMALRGGVDFEYRIERPNKFSAKMICTKMKDAVEPDDTYFEGKSVFLGFDEEEEMTSLVFSRVDAPVKEEGLLEGLQKNVYDLIESMADEEGQVDRKAFYKKAKLYNLITNLEQGKNILHALKAKNFINIDGKIITTIEEF